jgi:UPF0755 protein
VRQRDREPWSGSDQSAVVDGDAGHDAYSDDSGHSDRPGYSNGSGGADPDYSDYYGGHPNPRQFVREYPQTRSSGLAVEHGREYSHEPAREPAREYGGVGPGTHAHETHDDAGSLLDDYDSAEDDEGRIRRVGRGGRRDARPPRGRHGKPRRGGHRRLGVTLGVLFAVLLAVVAWLVVLPIYHYLSPSDYSGNGSGNVLVAVHADDDASQIATTLQGRGVVASVRAFTNAASSNSKSQNIQPGSYRLHRHMSANSALNLLLDPSSRVNADILVNEGATILDVEKRLTVPACSDSTGASSSCGPGLTRAQVQRAFTRVRSLGLPTDYLVNGQAPKSVEGFLFPATYYFADKTTASDALTQMISKFADEARGIDFTTSAKALHITPYQELIIASLAQSEAKYASDYPKVARVILNRLARHMPLQIDAATRYGAMLDGKDPSSVTYSSYNTPYNTYLHSGLPPTPIGNPGTDAMSGVAKPASGALLYYVNGDAQGHLVFQNTAAQFEKARQKCAVEHWGCA